MEAFIHSIYLPGLTATAEQTSYGLSYDLFQLYEQVDTRRDVTLIELLMVYAAPFQNEFDTGDSIIFDPVDKNYRNKRNGIIWGNATAPNGISFMENWRGTPVLLVAEIILMEPI